MAEVSTLGLRGRRRRRTRGGFARNWGVKSRDCQSKRHLAAHVLFLPGERRSRLFFLVISGERKKKKSWEASDLWLRIEIVMGSVLIFRNVCVIIGGRMRRR